MNSDNRELALAHQAADAAGEILRKWWRGGLSVEQKADASPVTEADRECEAVMRALIAQTFPDHGIVGEEYGNVRGDASFQWVLDPIDGTRAFIAGKPTFTSLIALAKDGIPILGVIDQPITNERWVGITGKPTLYYTEKNPHPTPLPIRERGASRSDASESVLSKARIATTSTDYFTPQEAPQFEKLKNACANTILGGDAYAYAMLANEQLDIVIDAGMKPYDFCALVPVVEGAGGVITDWEGAPLTLSSPGRVIAAANRQLYEQALRLIR